MLTTPILFSQAAFDATQEHTFTFNIVGGDQVTQNKLVITNQSTNEIVYQAVQTTYKFEHILPANTLTNGVYYAAYLITYDAAGDNSANSNSIQFYCYTTPSLVFSNLPTDSIILNSSYNFQATYSQTEGELLNSYTFTLYDAQKIQVATSGIQYVGTTTAPPTTISHQFAGFADKTNYYIRVNGQTIQGTQIDTGLVSIAVRYVYPSVFSIVELNNNCTGGYVQVKSNLIEINDRSNPDSPTYVDNNTAVDMRKDGDYVEWYDGFELRGDFTASLWGRDFNKNSDIIKMSTTTTTTTLVVGYRTNEDGTVYADLTVTNGTVVYYIYSASITAPTATDKVQFWFRRIGYQYTIKLAIV